MQEAWDGSMRCTECWEPRHPQDFVHGIEDNQSVPWSRSWNPQFTTTSTISVASAAFIILPTNVPAVQITGSITIGAILSQVEGRLIALQFVDGCQVLSAFTNVFLEGGNYTFKAGDVLFLTSRDTDWREVDRLVS